TARFYAEQLLPQAAGLAPAVMAGPDDLDKAAFCRPDGRSGDRRSHRRGNSPRAEIIRPATVLRSACVTPPRPRRILVRTSTLLRRAAALAVGRSLALGAGASAAPKSNSNPDLKPGRLTAYVTTDQNQLISLTVRTPDQLLSIRNISGLPAGVSLVGIDFRPK